MHLFHSTTATSTAEYVPSIGKLTPIPHRSTFLQVRICSRQCVQPKSQVLLQVPLYSGRMSSVDDGQTVFYSINLKISVPHLSSLLPVRHGRTGNVPEKKNPCNRVTVMCTYKKLTPQVFGQPSPDVCIYTLTCDCVCTGAGGTGAGGTCHAVCNPSFHPSTLTLRCGNQSTTVPEYKEWKSVGCQGCAVILFTDVFTVCLTHFTETVPPPAH